MKPESGTCRLVCWASCFPSEVASSGRGNQGENERLARLGVESRQGVTIAQAACHSGPWSGWVETRQSVVAPGRGEAEGQRSAAQKGRLVFAGAAAGEQGDCRVSAHAVKARAASNAHEGYWRRRLCPWRSPRCVAAGGESRAAVSGISGRAGDDDDAGGR